MTVSALAAPAAAHVARLDAALVGPRRIKRELIQEVSDHLEDATEANQTSGRTSVEAAELAVRDFGTVDEVAAPLQTTLAVASSRRTALLLFGVLIVQPFLWDSGLHLGGSGPEPEGGVFAVTDGILEIGGFAVLISALLVLIATGVGQRWFGAGRAVARGAAWFTVGATALFVASIAVMMSQVGASVGLWLTAGVLTAGPMMLTALSARRTLAACADLA